MTAMRPETTSEHIARDMREGRFPERSEPQMVADPTGTAPERIWLQDGGDFDAASEVTWCQHSIDDADTEYVRADLAAVQPAQVTLDDQERNYLHLHNAAFDVWRWFETARPDLIGPRAEKLRDAVMGPRPFGCVEPQPDPRDAVIARLVEAADECSKALKDYMKQYPHMVKGYLVDAEQHANDALAAAKAVQQKE